ncbi:hypothetical protein Lal_00044128 [Lupinus albus]|nr:hypothetical protein Lal_00044128 [Lupinus albus]
MDYFMMSKTLILVVSLTFLFLLTNAVPSTRPLHIVHHNIRTDLLNFCKHTTNPSLCAQTIQPHINHHDDLDPFKALEIEAQATLNETKKTIAIINELFAENNLNKTLMDAIKTCKKQYRNILDAIRETKDAIAQHDLIEAKFKFSAVISYQSTCKDAFEDVECPFAKYSETIFNLGGNTLDIIADLQKIMAPQEPTLPVPSTSSQSSSTSINVIGTIT